MFKAWHVSSGAGMVQGMTMFSPFVGGWGVDGCMGSLRHPKAKGIPAKHWRSFCTWQLCKGLLNKNGIGKGGGPWDLI